MLTDTVILLLFVAIAAVVGIILWRGGVAKPYDPNAVDLSSDFDPKHDHFSVEHAKKLQQQLKNEKAKSRGMLKPESVSRNDLEWDTHLTPPEHSDDKAERNETDRRDDLDRRANSDRRIFEDRRQSQ